MTSERCNDELVKFSEFNINTFEEVKNTTSESVFDIFSEPIDQVQFPGYPPFYLNFPETNFTTFPIDQNIGYYTPESALGGEKMQLNKIYKRKAVLKTSDSEVDNIIFVKTHNTGSSVVANILLKKAYDNNLLVGFPITDNENEIGAYPAQFDRQFIRPGLYSDSETINNSDKVNIITHHSRYSSDLSKILINPTNKRVITIVRHPLEQIKSVFKYYQDELPFKTWFDSSDNVAIRLQKFYNNPYKFYNTSVPYYFRAKNFQAFDLDLNENGYTESKLQDLLVKKFDLILVHEFLDESLLLLKKLLNWSFEDIAYLRSQYSPKLKENGNLSAIDKFIRTKVENFNDLDFAIYKIALKRLKNLLKNCKNLDEDLQILREKAANLRTKCTIGFNPLPDKKYIRYAKLYNNCEQYALSDVSRHTVPIYKQELTKNKVLKNLIYDQNEIQDQMIKNNQKISNFLNFGKWKTDNEFLPNKCKYVPKLSSIDVEMTDSNKKIITVIGNNRSKILANAIKSMYRLENLHFIYAERYSDLNESTLYSMVKSHYVIVGHHWLDNIENIDNYYFMDDTNRLEMVLNTLSLEIKQTFQKIKNKKSRQLPYKNTQENFLGLEKVLVLAAEPVTFPTRKIGPIEENRVKFNTEIKKITGKYSQNMFYMSNNIKTNFYQEKFLPQSNYRYKMQLQTLTDRTLMIPKNLEMDCHMILSYFTDQMCDR